MVNPGAFQGAHFAFLTGEKAAYATAVKEGYVADAIAIIQRRYFKRFPIDLPHTEEPAPEALASVNDNTPDFEPPEIDGSLLTVEECLAELERRKVRAKLIEYRKAQIKRWLAYQYMKDRDVDPKDTGEDNPLQILRYRLTGVGLKKPRAQNPVNLWRKSVKDIIEKAARDELTALAAEEGRLPSAKDHNKLAGIREKTARRMFKELSEADRAAWDEQATEDYRTAVRKYEEDRKKPLLTDPQDRQRCIEALVPFMQPILDLIVEATGMKATAMIGGPEPADQGRINIISIHSGSMPGHVPMNFGRAERAGYKKVIVPVFGSFLRRCWTPAECRARALDADFKGLNAMDLERNDINLDMVPYEEELTANGGAQNVPLTSFNALPLPLPATATPTFNPEGISGTTSIPPARGSPLPNYMPTAPTPPSANAPITAPTVALATVPAIVPTPTSPPMHLTVPSPTLSTSTSAHAPTAAPTPAPPAQSTGAPVTIPVPSQLAPPSSVAEVEKSTSPHQLPSDSAPTALTPACEPNDALLLPAKLLSSPRLTNEQLQDIRAAFEHPEPPSRSLSIDPWAVPARGSSPVVTPIPTPAASPGRRSQPPSSPEIPALPAARKRRHAPGAADDNGGAEGNKRARRGTSAARPPKTTPVLPAATATKKTPASVAQSVHSRRQGSASCRQLMDRSNSTIITAPSLPAVNAPTWYVNAVAALSSEELDSPTWTAVLKAWQAFEITMDFEDMPPLKAIHRPDAVKQWIGRRRSATYRPDITNVKAYGKEHMSWWTALQPEWRTANGEIVKGVTGDVSSVRRSGQNGILSVLASLFYWGLHARGARERAQWELGLVDCLEILTSK